MGEAHAGTPPAPSGRTRGTGAAGRRPRGTTVARRPSSARSVARLVLVAAALLLVVGCSADDPMNPSFPLRLEDAKAALREMRRDPRQLERPVVVLAGIHDPGVLAGSATTTLRRVTDEPDRVIKVSFFTASTFDDCRARVIEAVDAAFPNDDPEVTTEVDVVAISMGGLVARHAVQPEEGSPRRLRVRRLFTIATPHRGAKMAGVPTRDERILDMRAGSKFLSDLDTQASPEAPIVYPYVRLDDAVVGVDRSAPPGRNPWWVANIPLSLAHVGAGQDPRILADIARRLRGEEPYTLDPAAPLPVAQGTRDEP